MTLEKIQTQINTLTHFLSLVLNTIYRLETELKIIRQQNSTSAEDVIEEEEDSE